LEWSREIATEKRWTHSEWRLEGSKKSPELIAIKTLIVSLIKCSFGWWEGIKGSTVSISLCNRKTRRSRREVLTGHTWSAETEAREVDRLEVEEAAFCFSCPSVIAALSLSLLPVKRIRTPCCAMISETNRTALCLTLRILALR